MMDITAWRQFRNDDKSVVCRIQVSYKDGRKMRTISNLLSEWSVCGEGFSAKDKESILLYERGFKSDTLWKTFLRKFPYKIVEKTPTNKTRVYNAKKVI